MRALLEPSLTTVWALLIGLTLAGFGGSQASGWGFAAVMLAASGKAVLIARNYMELGGAPLPWRLVFYGMLGFGGTMILGLHFLG